jgi:hypothetical protein
MTILYWVLGFIALVWIAVTGFALLVNVITSSGQAGFWASMFRRCTPLEVALMSPGLLWVLPLTAAATAIRGVSRLRK